MSVVNASFDHPLILEEQGSALLVGGIMQHGFQCGMLWGAALAAGAQAFRLLGPRLQAECGAITAAQRLVDPFRNTNTYVDCGDITDVDWTESSQALKFIFRGGPIKCFRIQQDSRRRRL